MQPGMKEDVFTLDEGQVVIQWPEAISPDEIEDLEDWMQMMIRKVKRSARPGQPPEGEE